jgi:hypothetical protein
MASRRTTILLDPGLLDRVDRLARRRRTTKTVVIATALAAYLEAAEEEAIDLPFVAIGASGHGRLSLDGKRIAARELGERAR